MTDRPPKLCACGTEFMPTPNNYARAIRCPACKAARDNNHHARTPEQYQARQSAKTHNRIATQPYVFWDGEGVNDQLEVPELIETITRHDLTDGGYIERPEWSEVIEIISRHHYAYMAACTTGGTIGTGRKQRLIEPGFSSVERGPGQMHLGTQEALWWLWRLPQGSRWGYSLGYDWTMILIDLIKNEDDLGQLWQVYHPEKYPDGKPRDAFEPVWWQGWGFVKTQAAMELCRYVPERHRTKDTDTGRRSKFYQDGFKCFGGGSFVTQITNWRIGTQDERDAVAAMKKERSHFTALTDQVKRYCDLEVKLGAELCRTVVGTASELGIRVNKGKHYSTGSFAKALLNKHGVVARYTTDEHGDRVLEHEGHRGPDRYAGAPDRLRADLMRTFFGGRFEIRLTGLFARLFLKDFASAYPAVIRDLPCLSHGAWQDGYVPGAVNFGQVSWEPSHNGDSDFGPFPWRWPDQRIYYPEMGEGIYCEAEIRAAQQMPGFTITEERWFAFVPECDHRPLSFVQQYYDMRIELGKDGKGLVLKITLNSVYGTFADTVSADSKYASVVWAAIITATVRSWLLQVLSEYPDIVVGFATDGVMLTEDIGTWAGGTVYGEDVSPLPLGALGSEGTLTNCLMPQPGVYTADEGPAKKRHRTRGHNMDELLRLRAELASEWDWHGWDASVSYSRTRFIGARQAIARTNTHGVYGQWVDSDVAVSFKPSNREMLPSKEPLKPSIATMRHMFSEKIPALSSPYNKLIALETYAELRDRQEDNECQPDW